MQKIYEKKQKNKKKTKKNKKKQKKQKKQKIQKKAFFETYFSRWYRYLRDCFI